MLFPQRFPDFPRSSCYRKSLAKRSNRSRQLKHTFSYPCSKIKNKHESASNIPDIQNQARVPIRAQFLLASTMLHLQYRHASLLVPLSLGTHHNSILRAKSQNNLFIFHFDMKQKPVFFKKCILCENFPRHSHDVIKIVPPHWLL